MERYPMTPEGFEALQVEHKQLTSVERIKISREIEVAREHGDLRENAEYHAAKERQGQIEARIAHLEGMISRAEVIDDRQLGGDRVRFGARVYLEDMDSGEEKVYRIVGSEEADVNKGTISVTSPVARALINHEVGDEVRVKAPAGVRAYEITDIQWK
ncbi:MAG: transcription elongation factor GreA [Myxococcales bacterium]|nr:transcription elongation factor GreA [Myxococcales bacterium]MDD9968509.1 transcription elongation factor GreA [Myxococcales bacterium]